MGHGRGLRRQGQARPVTVGDRRVRYVPARRARPTAPIHTPRRDPRRPHTAEFHQPCACPSWSAGETLQGLSRLRRYRRRRLPPATVQQDQASRPAFAQTSYICPEALPFRAVTNAFAYGVGCLQRPSHEHNGLLMTTGFAECRRLAQTAPPSTRFASLGSRVRLELPSHPASRRRSCLRLMVRAISSTADSHPQAAAHAGRTTNEGPPKGGPSSSSEPYAAVHCFA